MGKAERMTAMGCHRMDRSSGQGNREQSWRQFHQHISSPTFAHIFLLEHKGSISLLCHRMGERTFHASTQQCDEQGTDARENPRTGLSVNVQTARLAKQTRQEMEIMSTIKSGGHSPFA